MFIVRHSFRSSFPKRCPSGNNLIRRSSSFAKDQGPKFRHFAAIGLVGTAIFIATVHRVDREDSKTSLAKKKNSFTEEEWATHLEGLKRKKLVFTAEDGLNMYLVPYVKDEAQVDQLRKSLGSAAVIDLDDLISRQFEDSDSEYYSLLRDTFVSKASSEGSSYQFGYRLAPGLFAHLVQLELSRIHKEQPQTKNFLLLRFPNNIKEAVKFEQDVALSRGVVLLDDAHAKSDVVEYFGTVNKVSKDITQL